jgi:16S rRNA (cytidine1402-2'-O)-methyltransferase
MPSLYVVATPIGNLEDISLRALRILDQVKLIAAEDTRRTRKLLNAYDIHTRLTSYHEHNKLAKLDSILGRLETEDVALVSDAGMPGIADPGQELITAASLKGRSVVPVPGPSAAITALAVSGLSTDRFSYIGFLPRKSGERRRLLETVVGETGSIVCLETPHRLRAALEDILLVLGDRPVAVCRQLTKLHEEVFGKTGEEKPQLTEAIAEKLAGMRRSGQTARQAVAALAGETGLSKKELYRAWLRLT